MEVALGVSWRSFWVLPGGHLVVFRARLGGDLESVDERHVGVDGVFNLRTTQRFTISMFCAAWGKLIVMYFEKTFGKLPPWEVPCGLSEY